MNRLSIRRVGQTKAGPKRRLERTFSESFNPLVPKLGNASSHEVVSIGDSPKSSRDLLVLFHLFIEDFEGLESVSAMFEAQVGRRTQPAGNVADDRGRENVGIP